MRPNQTCWYCQKKTEVINFQCQTCNKIQKIKEANPYDIFGTEKTFILNFDDLEEKYLRLQSIFHPDKFVNADSNQKQISIAESAKINNAYNVLMNNVDRLKVLLDFYGFKQDDKEGKSFKDPDLLEEIMDLQSKCMSIEHENEKQKIKNEIKLQIGSLENEIEKNIKEKVFSKAQDLSIKLSYLEKIRKDLK